MASRFCVPQRRHCCSQGSLLVVMLHLWSGIGSVAADKTLFTVKEARKHLKRVGSELAWPGFQGDTSLITLAFSNQSELESPRGAHPEHVKVASLSPYVLLIDEFLSASECDFLMAFGANRLKPAMVVQSGDNWYDTQSQTRNNEQLWLTQQEERGTPLLRHIMKRIHRTARVPDEYAEALQIGKYKTNTKYEGHIDSDPNNKVGRPATMLIYLNDVEEGGDTVFPVDRDDCSAGWRKDPKTNQDVYGAKLCCDSPEKDTPRTVRVRAKRGRAVLFFSHLPDGQVDQNSLHIGCPVNKGEKWVAQRWLRYEPYNKVNYAEGPGWDSRFDGILVNDRATARHEVHDRSLSQITPKAYLEEHFLSEEEASALQEAMLQRAKGSSPIKPSGMELDKAELESVPVLKELTERVHLLARVPHKHGLIVPHKHPGDVVLKFRSLEIGDSEEVQMEDDPPTIKVFVYLPVAVGEGEKRGGEFIAPAGDMWYPEWGTGRQKAVSQCKADFAACCRENSFKVDGHRGDAVLLYIHGQDGRLDPTTQHGHCKLEAGRLWIAEWRFYLNPLAQDAPASQKLDVQPTVKFENQGAETVEIFWVPDHGGKEASMGDAPPGETKQLNSFAGHNFNVRTKTGVLVDKFHVGATAMQRFLITSKQAHQEM